MEVNRGREIDSTNQVKSTEVEKQPDNAPPTTNLDDGTLSKTQMKRRQKRELNRLKWVEAKEKRKKRKKEQKEKNKTKEPKDIDLSPEAVLYRKEKQLRKKENHLMKLEEGIQIVIDCQFEEKMMEKEKNSLSQQIMYSYGINRRSSTPSLVYLTSLGGKIKENLLRINGFETWLGFGQYSKSYMDIFKRESLVYLTADSPNTITELDKSKVYIIGGIVDHNRLKSITYDKAKEQGIATAKLPLDQVVKMGDTSRVLTVNHVFEILLNYQDTKSWMESAITSLPSRKGVQAIVD